MNTSFGYTRIRKIWAFLSFTTVIALAAKPPAPAHHGIPNFRVVSGDQKVYRGGQPSTPDGWAYLQSLGVTNIVKLNTEKEGSDGSAMQHGIQVQHFPITLPHQLLSKPSSTLVSNAVYAITPGTYIHCEHGEDRTGLIVGCFRVWRDGFSKTNAWHEMLDDGFHPSLHGLSEFWKENVE